jgi:acyl transferase domain-containing protein
VDPDRKVLRQRWPSELFLIAADSREKFVQQVDRLAAEAATAGPAGRELRELAQECALSYRAGAKIRLGMVAGSHAELAQRIEAWRRSPEVASVAADAAAIDAPGIRVLDPRGVYFAESAAGTPPRVAFLFPGQGAQYPTMLRDLAMHFEEVGETFAAADATLHGTLPERLSGVIFPPPAFNEDERSARRTALTRTRFAQPAIGAASVAMTMPARSTRRRSTRCRRRAGGSWPR